MTTPGISDVAPAATVVGVEPVEPIVELGDATDQWRDSWDDALRAVELDVDDAEKLIHDMHAGVAPPEISEPRDWVAPSLLGPVPTEFADRARALLQRQLDVSDRLAEAMVQARSQRKGLSKFDRAERPPVYVDRAL